MQAWDGAYRQELAARFARITDRAAEHFEPTKGLQAPAVDDIAIGQAKEVRAAVLFFDICSFSRFSASSTAADAKKTLLLLNTTIPLMMSIVYDHGGYVEKNTGDGLMAVLGVGRSNAECAETTLAVAMTMHYAIRECVNPQLRVLGISEIEVRIAADIGTILLAKIGVPSGSANQQRNFITAVGAAANLASKLVEDVAKAGDVLVTDLVRLSTPAAQWSLFVDATPVGWTWRHIGTNDPYLVWRYTGVRTKFSMRLLAGILAGSAPQQPLSRRSLFGPPPTR